MGNVVYKLTSKEIQSLMAQTTFETTKLPQGMKARTRYQNTVINIYSSGKVMFQGKNADQLASQLLPDKQSTTGKHTSSNTTIFNIIVFIVLEAMKQAVATILVH